MIHFRLRRSLRLAVDLLSLNIAGSSTGHYSARYFSSGDRSNASENPLLPTLPVLRLPWLRRSRATHTHSLESHFKATPRRYLACCGILLALSLEICGCDPETISSLGVETASPEPSYSGQALSFYDPLEPVAGLGPTSLPIDDPFFEARPIPAETRSLPWAIPESVYFVYKGHPPDPLLPRQPPVATAFVLSVPYRGASRSPSHTPDRGHTRHIRFLVTARHVVDPQWAHCSEQNPASIDLRLNRRNGGVGYETVSLGSGATRRFYTPIDSSADIAVIPLDQSLIPAIDDYKFIDVPFHLLLTDSEMPFVREEQPIMTARPSARPSGELSNYPVFDGGVLSEMPSEAVGVQCGVLQKPSAPTRMLHVWFINAGVPQGVSGAPVYTSIARGTGAIETRVLLGVQSVAWPDKGVAGITPSPALGDLIRSAMRKSKLNLDFYRGPNP